MKPVRALVCSILMLALAGWMGARGTDGDLHAERAARDELEAPTAGQAALERKTSTARRAPKERVDGARCLGSSGVN